MNVNSAVQSGRSALSVLGCFSQPGVRETNVVQTGSSIRVIMIQLDVTVPSNPLGLTPGTVIDIASALVNVN